MANPAYIPITTHTGTADAQFNADWALRPFNLSYAVEVPGGVTISYTVQYTLDDVNDLSWTPVWIADPTNGSAQTATQGGFYSFPIRGLRVNVTALAGGTARLAVIQAMPA